MWKPDVFFYFLSEFTSLPIILSRYTASRHRDQGYLRLRQTLCLNRVFLRVVVMVVAAVAWLVGGCGQRLLHPASCHEEAAPGIDFFV